MQLLKGAAGSFCPFSAIVEFLGDCHMQIKQYLEKFAFIWTDVWG